MRAFCRESLTLWTFLLGCLAGSGEVHASGYVQFLLPDGCLPADGGPPFEVFVYVGNHQGRQGKVNLDSSKGSFGEVQELVPGLYRSTFLPPRLKTSQSGKFTCSMKGKQQTIRGSQQVLFCPHPTGRVSVVAEPSWLLAGEHQKAQLKIRVADSKGNPKENVRLEITSNVGIINGIKAIGQGNYRAVFNPPNEPYPQVAIIMVANPEGSRLDRIAVARTVIPITARIKLPGRTEPGTQITMKIATEKFGPVVGDASGRFEIPIRVPPGYEQGLATSIDRVGNKKTRKVNLYLPETNQLGLWAYPRTLPADGKSRSRLLITTMDRFGKPTHLGGVQVVARAGTVGKLIKITKGLYEAYYTSPGQVGSGQDFLRVKFPRGGAKSQAKLNIRLLSGPSNKVVLNLPNRLVADGQTAGHLSVQVRDAKGNPVTQEQVELSSSLGKIRWLGEKPPGDYLAELIAPNMPSNWVARIHAKVTSRSGQTPKRFLVSKDSLENEPMGAARLKAVLVDELGRSVGSEQVELIVQDHVLEGKTNTFGQVTFAIHPGSSSPRVTIASLSSDEARVSRQIYWIKMGAGLKLLPINLDDSLPVGGALTANGVVRIHPPLPANMMLETFAPQSPTGPWRIRARLTESSGRYLSGSKVEFFTSEGQLSPIRKISTGVYEVNLFPGPPGWKRIVISAVESIHHLGATCEIYPQSDSRR